MARPALSVDDDTPLDGDHIAVGSRTGWLLRSWREQAGLSLGAMHHEVAARGVAVSAATLSRIERGQWRRSDVLAAYEEVLGLEPARLRAAVDVLSRSFPYGPRDEELPEDDATALARYDAAVAGVRHSDEPTGAQWLELALAQEPGRGFGLPTDDARPLVAQLVSELARAVGTAFVARYEALARLRCGKYAVVVAEAAVDHLTRPGVQLVADVADCLSERPTPSLLDWAARQLGHPSDMTVRAAVTILENTANARVLGAADWREVPGCFAEAYEHATRTGDDARQARLDRLYGTLPRDVRDRIRRALRRPPPPRRGPVRWTRGRSNQHYAQALELSTQITEGREEPLLARLLFEMLYEFRPARSFNAALVVAASPYAAATVDALVAAALDHPDDATREGAVSALCPSLRAESRPAVGDLLARPDPDLQVTGLIAAGMTGQPLPPATVGPLLDDPGLRPWAVWWAGMAAPAELARWTASGRLGDAEAPAVAWWRSSGPRVAR